jgi:hypothetical protein
MHPLLRSLAPVVDVSSNDSESSISEWEYIPKTRFRRTVVPQKPTIGPDAYTFEELVEKINHTRGQLERSLEEQHFYSRYKSFFVNVHSIVALGIGSISESRSALFQFSFLLIMVEWCRGKSELDDLIVFYDPIATETEKRAIASYGIQTPSEFPLDGPSTEFTHPLLFMPHCDRVLYERVLATIQPGVLLSNKFSYYGSHFPGPWERVCSVMEEEPMHLIEKDHDRFSSLTNDEKVKFKPRYAMKHDFIPYEAFSDLAFMTFPDVDIRELTASWSAGDR